jgi:DNA-binding NarL/FixJ family response regulator
VHFRRELPWLRVLAVVSPEKPNLATAALEAGAVGCIPDTLSFFATAAAIRFLAEAGGIYVTSYELLPRAPMCVGPRDATSQVMTPPPRQTSPS